MDGLSESASSAPVSSDALPWGFSPLERGAYKAITIDPPWHFKSNSKAKPGRNAMRHYPVMPLRDIAALPVGELAAENCALFLWITGPLLVKGVQVELMRGWGFKPTAMAFTWVKLNKNAPTMFMSLQDFFLGGGFTTRKNAEFCVLGKRGRSVRHSAAVPEPIISPRREHSRKPLEFRERVERYIGPEGRIAEIFSRSDRPRWECWGNEVGKFGVDHL